MQDWPVEAEELQTESQQVHTDSNPYSSTHLRVMKILSSLLSKKLKILIFKQKYLTFLLGCRSCRTWL